MRSGVTIWSGMTLVCWSVMPSLPANRPKADETPAPNGNTTFGILRMRAISAPWSGAEPPVQIERIAPVVDAELSRMDAEGAGDVLIDRLVDSARGALD